MPEDVVGDCFIFFDDPRGSEGSRIREVVVSYSVLEEFLKGEAGKFTTDVPEDMRIVYVLDKGLGTIRVGCESQEFELVPPGCTPRLAYFSCTRTFSE